MVSLAAGDGGKTVLRIWLSAAGVIVCALLSALAGLITPWLLLAALSAGLATVVAALWYPVRFAASVSGHFDGTAVRARRGVFWRREIFIPVDALRTYELSHTPLQKRYACCTVVLRFAGGAVSLPLLSMEAGEALLRELELAEDDIRDEDLIAEE